MILGEQQITHGHDAEQFSGAVDDVAVSDDRRAHQRPQLLDGVAHRDVGEKHRPRRGHHPADRALGKLRVGAPLRNHFRRCGMHHAIDQAAGELGDDVLGQCRCEVLQYRGDDCSRMFRQQLSGFFRRSRFCGECQFAVFVVCCCGSLMLFLFHRSISPVSHRPDKACGGV